MLPQILQGLMSSCHILKKFLKEKEIVRQSNAYSLLSSKPQIKKIKEWHNKKREERNEEALVASARNQKFNQHHQEGKNNLKKTYSPSYRIPRIQTDSMENCFNMDRTFMEFQDKEEERMRQPSFPKKYVCLLML
ncbi:hypothetical protein O181_052946 [Austropuccinia psidii MF-1]|uniref:Uncharacterized protein n=1 Tax=Austropuccinia psidii MF-1 TaxID=1389203 RepID=A0A9Q3E6L5_9BASI|nr:hypothetical protein [Austropuccinia psidii MF-1]